MVVIYIRHAEKEYSNNSAKINSHYRLDPAITEKGIKESRKLCQKLIDMYGLPEIIYYSPFLRCRQTLGSFLEQLKEMNYDTSQIKLIPNSEITEYLGNQKILDWDFDVTEETKNLDRNSHPETYKTFSLRVENHYQKIKNNGNKQIWIITHGIILSKITQLINNTKGNFSFDYLGTLVI